MKKQHLIGIAVLVILIIVAGVYSWQTPQDSTGDSVSTAPAPELVAPVSEEVAIIPTERFGGMVDGVSVVFEHQDYTQYRLIKNDTVETGSLNTERGYEDDIDATVYVLNWQAPVALQQSFVRLTDQPGVIFVRNADGTIDQTQPLERIE